MTNSLCAGIYRDTPGYKLSWEVETTIADNITAARATSKAAGHSGRCLRARNALWPAGELRHKPARSDDCKGRDQESRIWTTKHVDSAPESRSAVPCKLPSTAACSKDILRACGACKQTMQPAKEGPRTQSHQKFPLPPLRPRTFATAQENCYSQREFKPSRTISMAMRVVPKMPSAYTIASYCRACSATLIAVNRNRAYEVAGLSAAVLAEFQHRRLRHFGRGAFKALFSIDSAQKSEIQVSSARELIPRSCFGRGARWDGGLFRGVLRGSWIWFERWTSYTQRVGKSMNCLPINQPRTYQWRN